jgi:hypothetical protein
MSRSSLTLRRIAPAPNQRLSFSLSCSAVPSGRHPAFVGPAIRGGPLAASSPGPGFHPSAFPLSFQRPVAQAIRPEAFPVSDCPRTKIALIPRAARAFPGTAIPGCALGLPQDRRSPDRLLGLPFPSNGRSSACPAAGNNPFLFSEQPTKTPAAGSSPKLKTYNLKLSTRETP